MKQRGRKSQFSVVHPPPGGPQRLRPPDDLTEPERQAFADIVASSPAEHFALSDLPLVVSYATAIVQERLAAQHLQREGYLTETGKPSPWVTVQEKAHRMMVALCMRLRLSPQARMHYAKPAPKAASVSYYERMALEGYDDVETPS